MYDDYVQQIEDEMGKRSVALKSLVKGALQYDIESEPYLFQHLRALNVHRICCKSIRIYALPSIRVIELIIHRLLIGKSLEMALWQLDYLADILYVCRNRNKKEFEELLPALEISPGDSYNDAYIQLNARGLDRIMQTIACFIFFFDRINRQHLYAVLILIPTSHDCAA